MEYWVNVVLLFFIFGFVGWCMEVALKYRQYHRFINRGFLTGPILPIYGCGVALITVVVGNLASVESGVVMLDDAMVDVLATGLILRKGPQFIESLKKVKEGIQESRYAPGTSHTPASAAPGEAVSPGQRTQAGDRPV